LIATLNDLYIASTEDSDFEDLFEHDDVGSPSVTLVLDIGEDFDLQRVTEKLRARLQVQTPDSADEIGGAGIVWSHGRYDFVYDSQAESLRISHGYSHKPEHTRSVCSILKQIIDYAVAYLEEVKESG